MGNVKNEGSGLMFGFKRITATIMAVSFAVIMLAQSALAGNVTVSSKYVVFAWNDLGMHCVNPSFNKAVILPPYNTLIVQVVQRGDPPAVVTKGLTVHYSIINNTYSSGRRKGMFSQFWTYCLKLFGVSLKANTGLNLVDPSIHNGLAGNMVVHGTQFEADGIPLTPINNSGVWNPYQVAVIIVRDRSGHVVAQTRTTVPVSDEINCAKCHGSTDPFGDILKKHDALSGTNLVGSTPVLCSGCHADPILHTVNQNGATEYLSEAIHKFHSDKGATCYDCHPGSKTQCNRSLAHTASDGGCTTCHGDMATVASTIASGRVPWMDEPKCVTCHSGIAEVDTGATLYRNAFGHGGLHCSACHYSPHAMVPSRVASDNYQAMQYQGAAKTIGSCGACHSDSRGKGLADYLGTHGYLRPEKENGCNICHTQITTTDTTKWPHQYQWPNSNVSSPAAFGGTTSGSATSGGSTTNPAGAALYAQYCAGCHGPLATSAKLGASSAMIQTGIGTVSAMSSLSFLTTTQIQDISQALSGSPSGGGGGGTTTTDGATLYTTYCAGCHGPLATSDKAGASATAIQDAISTVTDMSSLSALSSAQIQAISQALASSTSGGGDD